MIELSVFKTRTPPLESTRTSDYFAANKRERKQTKFIAPGKQASEDVGCAGFIKLITLPARDALSAPLGRIAT